MMLIDSNIFIYAIQPNYSFLIKWLINKDVAVSSITLLEVLGYHQLTETDKQDFGKLFECTEIYPVTQEIIEHGILLRQKQKMSLGDSIIAATALVYQQILITRNVKDFDWIVELKLINPIDQE